MSVKKENFERCSRKLQTGTGLKLCGFCLPERRWQGNHGDKMQTTNFGWFWMIWGQNHQPWPWNTECFSEFETTRKARKFVKSPILWVAHWYLDFGSHITTATLNLLMRLAFGHVFGPAGASNLPDRKLFDPSVLFGSRKGACLDTHGQEEKSERIQRGDSWPWSESVQAALWLMVSDLDSMEMLLKPSPWCK